MGRLCNVICVQPRRVAAISLAYRDADERKEPLGLGVGFRVRAESIPPTSHDSITFCTVGAALRIFRPKSGQQKSIMKSVTHSIVDEVHERSAELDLLVFVLRHGMCSRTWWTSARYKILISLAWPIRVFF